MEITSTKLRLYILPPSCSRLPKIILLCVTCASAVTVQTNHSLGDICIIHSRGKYGLGFDFFPYSINISLARPCKHWVASPQVMLSGEKIRHTLQILNPIPADEDSTICFPCQGVGKALSQGKHIFMVIGWVWAWIWRWNIRSWAYSRADEDYLSPFHFLVIFSVCRLLAQEHHAVLVAEMGSQGSAVRAWCSGCLTPVWHQAQRNQPRWCKAESSSWVKKGV